MNLEKAQLDAWKKIIENSQPVDESKIEKYKQEMAEDYSKYIIENQLAVKKTAELSRVVCVA